MTYSHTHGARGVSVFYVHSERTRRVERYIIAFFCVFFVLVTSSVTLRVVGGVEQTSLPAPVQRILAAAPVFGGQVDESAQTTFDAEELQKVVSSWSSKNRGSESVTVMAQDGSVLATSGPDQTFFMASVYKLYVAYLGYQDIDSGKYQLSDPYANGWTRGKCLDEMIRNSDSPCAEKMMAEYGKAAIQTKLQSYGLTHTSFRALTTSSHDVAIVVQRIMQGTNLSPASHSSLLTSMKEQKYRNGLPKGFSGITTYDKVGFRDQAEYHDVGFIELADGRKLVVVTLTSDVGVRTISQLATSLEKTF